MALMHVNPRAGRACTVNSNAQDLIVAVKCVLIVVVCVVYKCVYRVWKEARERFSFTS